MSIDVAILLYGSSFLRVSDGSLDSELSFATRVMRKAVEQGGSLPVCLSICVQRAALKTPPPFGRTLSLPETAARLSRDADSCPETSSGPLPQILSSRRGSGSRRHTRWVRIRLLRRMSGVEPSGQNVADQHLLTASWFR